MKGSKKENILVDWLTRSEEGLYSLQEAKELFEVRELGPVGWLVLDKKEELWLRFAVFSFASKSEGDEITYLSLVFNGEGSPELRECRHSYWGVDGYIYYPSKYIVAALKELSEFFDLD